MPARWPEPVRDSAISRVDSLSLDVRPVEGGFLTFKGILS